MHPVFQVYSPADVAVARCYLRQLARLAPKHEFGFVGQKQSKSMQIVSGERPAAFMTVSNLGVEYAPRL